MTGEREPVFAFQKDKSGREKMIIRDFSVLSPTSCYFNLNSGISNIVKFYKMSSIEWEIINTLTEGNKSEIEFLK